VLDILARLRNSGIVMVAPHEVNLQSPRSGEEKLLPNPAT